MVLSKAKTRHHLTTRRTFTKGSVEDQILAAADRAAPKIKRAMLDG
ncbi:unnamed protein product, partial [marine sediment metagenome]